MRSLSVLLLTVTITATLLMVASPAWATTFTVNSTEDLSQSPSAAGCSTGRLVPGGGIANEPECTLRAAIQVANINDQDDTITFGSWLSGTITLTQGQLEITNDNTSGPDLNIEGPQGSLLTVSGNNLSRVFQIDSGSDATIDGLKISGGKSSSVGGGILDYGTLALTNTTVSSNTSGRGGGIYTVDDAYPLLTNTIVARNTANTEFPDAYGAFTSQGNNLIGNTGGSSGWVASDLLNRNPQLGSLQNNGGPTKTHAILQGSPAIDRAANITCEVTDQRGVARPQDGDSNGSVICDIGAFERDAPTITNLKPAPGSETRDLTPLIAATVRDEQTNLAKTNIKLFVDEDRNSTFSYDRSTDRLSYTSGQLSFGRHTVKIVATDGVNTTIRSWSFRVVRG